MPQPSSGWSSLTALDPILIEAGCAYPHETGKSKEDKPIMHTKYGMHGFGHFFASWAIKQGFTPMKLQDMLGHIGG